LKDPQPELSHSSLLCASGDGISPVLPETNHVCEKVSHPVYSNNVTAGNEASNGRLLTARAGAGRVLQRQARGPAKAHGTGFGGSGFQFNDEGRSPRAAPEGPRCRGRVHAQRGDQHHDDESSEGREDCGAAGRAEAAEEAEMAAPRLGASHVKFDDYACPPRQHDGGTPFTITGIDA
jgi:hypothetical protein